MTRARGSGVPRVLTIAGSDLGGGAGIQADLKTFAAHGVYGMSVVTSVTAQNTLAVTAIHPVPQEVVAAQIDAVFDDLGVDAVKIGMLGNAETVARVAERLRSHRSRADLLPIVLDPVMVAKSGDSLLEKSAVRALCDLLLPIATVIAPNLPEAGILLRAGGTGCTLSAAVAARLARGESMSASVEGSIDYLHGAIAAAPQLGEGYGPVDHLYLMKTSA